MVISHLLTAPDPVLSLLMPRSTLQTVQYRCKEPVISHRGHLVDPPTQPGAGAASAVARKVKQLVVRHRPDHHLLAGLARVADPGQAGGQHPELVLAAGDEVCHRGLGVDGGLEPQPELPLVPVVQNRTVQCSTVQVYRTSYLTCSTR